MDGGNILIVLVLIGLYFIPSVVAAFRDHPNGAAITVLNLLAGWTFIGWIAALVWSFTAKPSPVVRPKTALPEAPDTKAEEEYIAGLRPRLDRIEGVAGPSGLPATMIEPTDVTFDYLDARGRPTRRTVTVKSIENDFDGTLATITGYCHTRKAPRTFRIARMDGVLADDGEVLPPDRFFEDLIDDRQLPPETGP